MLSVGLHQTYWTVFSHHKPVISFPTLREAVLEMTNLIYESIIKREFERVTQVPVLSVELTDDEQIFVRTKMGKFVMDIGSDDDGFDFRDEAGHEVTFPFPPDWIAAQLPI